MWAGQAARDLRGTCADLRWTCAGPARSCADRFGFAHFAYNWLVKRACLRMCADMLLSCNMCGSFPESDVILTKPLMITCPVMKFMHHLLVLGQHAVTLPHLVLLLANSDFPIDFGCVKKVLCSFVYFVFCLFAFLIEFNMSRLFYLKSYLFD